MGKDLLSTLVAATDLPTTAVEKELHSLIKKAGYDEEAVTLEELREAMALYLQTVFLELYENEEPQYRVS